MSTLNEPDWLPNLQHTRQHRAVHGWSGSGTGIVAACDKKGVFLDEGDVTGLPKCRSCLRFTGEEGDR